MVVFSGFIGLGIGALLSLMMHLFIEHKKNIFIIFNLFKENLFSSGKKY